MQVPSELEAHPDRLPLRRRAVRAHQHGGRALHLPGEGQDVLAGVGRARGARQEPQADQRPRRRHVELRSAALGAGHQGGALPRRLAHGGRNEGKARLQCIDVHGSAARGEGRDRERKPRFLTWGEIWETHEFVGCFRWPIK